MFDTNEKTMFFMKESMNLLDHYYENRQKNQQYHNIKQDFMEQLSKEQQEEFQKEYLELMEQKKKAVYWALQKVKNERNIQKFEKQKRFRVLKQIMDPGQYDLNIKNIKKKKQRPFSSILKESINQNPSIPNKLQGQNIEKPENQRNLSQQKQSINLNSVSNYYKKRNNSLQFIVKKNTKENILSSYPNLEYRPLYKQKKSWVFYIKQQKNSINQKQKCDKENVQQESQQTQIINYQPKQDKCFLTTTPRFYIKSFDQKHLGPGIYDHEDHFDQSGLNQKHGKMSFGVFQKKFIQPKPEYQTDFGLYNIQKPFDKISFNQSKNLLSKDPRFKYKTIVEKEFDGFKEPSTLGRKEKTIFVPFDIQEKRTFDLGAQDIQDPGQYQQIHDTIVQKSDQQKTREIILKKNKKLGFLTQQDKFFQKKNEKKKKRIFSSIPTYHVYRNDNEEETKKKVPFNSNTKRFL